MGFDAEFGAQEYRRKSPTSSHPGGTGYVASSGTFGTSRPATLATQYPKTMDILQTGGQSKVVTGASTGGGGSAAGAGSDSAEKGASTSSMGTPPQGVLLTQPPTSSSGPSIAGTASVIRYLPRDYRDKIIFGSIDCLERFAGLTNKIQAFKFFLENYPQHHKRFILLQYLYLPPSVTFDDTSR